MTIWQILAIVCMSIGFLFLAIGALGVLKFPDFFTRIHAAGVGDTLGMLLIIAGMMFAVGLRLLTLKILLVFLVLLLSNPFGTNLIMLEGVHYTNYKEYLRQKKEAK